MSSIENPFAGQGPVMLDIGGDIGALVVTMPSSMEGVEIDIRPVTVDPHDAHTHDAHTHDGHTHDGHTHDGHTHDGHAHEHAHGPVDAGSEDGPGGVAAHLTHVAVVGRPAGSDTIYSAVYGDLLEGDYELSEKPFAAVQLRVRVMGGEVAQARWPGLPS